MKFFDLKVNLRFKAISEHTIFLPRILKKITINRAVTFVLFISALFLTANAGSQTDEYKERVKNAFVYWHGTRAKMTIHEFASYCAPVFWFSADEPMLNGKSGKDIMIPQNFPFEKNPGTPVVYYQVKNIFTSENKQHRAFTENKQNYDSSIIDLNFIKAIEIQFNHYYPFEAGLGKHHHDTEQAGFKIVIIAKQLNDTTKEFYLTFIQATAKAHALEWYDNIYNLDLEALEMQLPFHILVEEGKHASCTDVNGDGYYTPGYDVNLRKNDAWGLRDVIRSGELFTSEYAAYMSKVRKPEFRVLPPLPPDSPHRQKYMRDSVYAPDNAVYELRRMPSPLTADTDLALRKDMKDYYAGPRPDITDNATMQKLENWWETNQFIKSIGIMARYNNSFGFSVSFPLLIVKNVETPLIGGWIVNRIYAQGDKLNDIGYNLLVTPSASRFMDPYLAAGIEINTETDALTGSKKYKTDAVLETGLKFRANVKFTPLKFLSSITDFWGLRVGIKNKGFRSIREITYVFEFGAGVW